MEGIPKRTPWTPGEILAACVHEIEKKKTKTTQKHCVWNRVRGQCWQMRSQSSMYSLNMWNISKRRKKKGKKMPLLNLVFSYFSAHRV